MSVLAPTSPAVDRASLRNRLLAAGPVAALAAASLIWGTADVASKEALDVFPPIALSALRYTIALALFQLACRRAGVRPVTDHRAALLGIFGIALTFITLNLGLRWTHASTASLLQGATPVLAAALALAAGRERLGARLFTGMSVSLGGVAIIAIAGGASLNLQTGGNLLILISACCFAAFIVFGRPVFVAHGSVAVLAGATRYAIAVLIPAAILEFIFVEPRQGGIALEQIAIVLYLGACCSALTYALWGYALRSIESGRAAIFDNFTPVIGVIAGVSLLGDPFTGRHALGMALVMIGLAIVLYDTARQNTHAVSNNTET